MAVCSSCGRDKNEDASMSYEHAVKSAVRRVALDFATFIKNLFEFDERINRDAAVDLLKWLVKIYDDQTPAPPVNGDLGLDGFHETSIQDAVNALSHAVENYDKPGVFLRDIDVVRKRISFVDGHYLGVIEKYIAIEEIDAERKRALVLNAIKRHSNDPKQVAKTLVKECWLEWQKKPDRYNSQSAFAMDVLSKVQTNDKGEPIISFDTIVKKWLPQWRKE